MLVHSHIPAPPLADFVDHFWIHEGPARGGGRERALPTGTTELVINLRADRLTVADHEAPHRPRDFPGALVCGPHSDYFILDSAEQETILGVHFRPGGTRPFFRYPATEFRNAHVALEQLWGQRAVELRERLLDTPTPAARFRLLERFLLAAGSGRFARHPAVDRALRAFGREPAPPTIAAVSAQLGLSARHFGALFAAEVGLTPKRFCRIRRFQALLHRIERGHPVDWAELALACGYYDQAHFLRDFRAFTGLTPTDYLARRGDYPNHVPLAP